MKKTIPMLLCLLLLTNVGAAQVHAGLSSKISIPLKFAYFISLGGAGFHIEGGYLLKERIDFNVGAENVWFISPDKGLKTSTYQVAVRYMFLRKSVKPYIGVGAGYFQTSFREDFFGEYYKSREKPGIGCIPSAGVLIDSKLLKGLYINPEFSYYYTSPPQRIKPVNFSIGIVYLFEGREKTDANKK